MVGFSCRSERIFCDVNSKLITRETCLFNIIHPWINMLLLLLLLSRVRLCVTPETAAPVRQGDSLECSFSEHESGSGRSSGEGNGYPLQYSCLEKSMDRGAWQNTVHGVTKSQIWLSDWTDWISLSSTLASLLQLLYKTKKSQHRKVILT